ncbi:hypothetical protein AYO49_04780 [Verrucomicrobiaceae bacterium SCGC AG-212-N21]|nr:hypothetical protein AYO49_04780 [Verrucomicrobiaceae bacterium SCGC AG-212-N21]
MTSPPLIAVDTREPENHPWFRTPAWQGVSMVRRTLETGDFALAANPAVCVERKALGDFLSCIGGERERFERELKRARYCDAFAVVVEGDFAGALSYAGGLHPASIVGTVAAWSRRYGPIVFCSTPRIAADFTLRFLSQPVQEARKLARAAAEGLSVES